MDSRNNELEASVAQAASDLISEVIDAVEHLTNVATLQVCYTSLPARILSVNNHPQRGLAQFWWKDVISSSLLWTIMRRQNGETLTGRF